MKGYFFAAASALLLGIGQLAVAQQVVLDTNVTIQPDVLQTISLDSSTQDRGYVLEVTPLQSVDATFVESAVRPEFDGNSWNDVARVRTAPGSAPVTANVRVYDTSSLPVVSSYILTLQPGVWHGAIVGSSSLERGYVMEVTPLDNIDAEIDRHVVQPEYNGSTWNDVARVQTRPQDPVLDAHVRVYATATLPVLTEFNTVIQLNVLHGFPLGDASAPRGYIVELTPQNPAEVVFDRFDVRPELAGVHWDDVLRIRSFLGAPSMPVNVRVYTMQGPPVSIEASSWGALKARFH